MGIGNGKGMGREWERALSLSCLNGKNGIDDRILCAVQTWALLKIFLDVS